MGTIIDEQAVCYLRILIVDEMQYLVAAGR